MSRNVWEAPRWLEGGSADELGALRERSEPVTRYDSDAG